MSNEDDALSEDVSRARRRLSTSLIMAASMCASHGLDVPYKALSASRGPRGRGMQIVGQTEDGRTLLQDHGGRQYTKDQKGTIRRYKP